VRAEFLLDPEIRYLNHGSYGACPRPVFARYQAWQRELERQPVEFIARRLPGLLAAARAELGAAVGAAAAELVFVPNATTGVNLAARAVRLGPGDEVLSTGLEYGACDLAWEHVCARAGAAYVRAEVPLPVERPQDVVERVLARVTPRTRALFLSHVASDTALVLPAAELVAAARDRGLVTIVDGAHAPGHVPVDLATLGADFYAGNCHKWLYSPKGAGFLHARPELHDLVDPLVVSWGSGDERPTFVSRNEYQGTRDPSAFLTVPDAIRWFERHDDPERGRRLALETRRRLSELSGVEPVGGEALVGRMVSVSVPHPDPDVLKARLYDVHRIEVPVRRHDGGALVRVSFAAYNDESDVDSLVAAVDRELRTES
jgi:isopenicillin-N epimerase